MGKRHVNSFAKLHNDREKLKTLISRARFKEKVGGSSNVESLIPSFSILGCKQQKVADLCEQKGLCWRPTGTQRRDGSWNLAHGGLRAKIRVTGEKTWLRKWAGLAAKVLHWLAGEFDGAGRLGQDLEDACSLRGSLAALGGANGVGRGASEGSMLMEPPEPPLPLGCLRPGPSYPQPVPPTPYPPCSDTWNLPSGTKGGWGRKQRSLLPTPTPSQAYSHFLHLARSGHATMYQSQYQ